MRFNGGEGGQASVELVALLPLIAALAAGLLQALVFGQAIWLSQTAARAAARAQSVGGDPVQAARSALPDRLERRLVVQAQDGGIVVRVRVPSLAGGTLTSVTGAARMPPQA